MKFGGTSLEDAAAIRRAIRIVKQRLAHNPVVVVSALADVTDQLLAAGQAAAKGQSASAAASLQYLQRRHEQVALDAAGSEAFGALQPQLASEFEQLHRLLPAISSFGELTRQLQDQFIGAGECLSSRIVQAAFVQAGVDSVWLDARECIVTDAAHTQATPLVGRNQPARARCSHASARAIAQVPVIGGFIGSTRDGIPTTLGRGGSDFTASIVGAALLSSRIEIWTDVDGILTTDPKLCPEARRVPTMSFEEAADLAYFGAKSSAPGIHRSGHAQKYPGVRC